MVQEVVESGEVANGASRPPDDRPLSRIQSQLEVIHHIQPESGSNSTMLQQRPQQPFHSYSFNIAQQSQVVLQFGPQSAFERPTQVRNGNIGLVADSLQAQVSPASTLQRRDESANPVQEEEIKQNEMDAAPAHINARPDQN